MTVWLTPIQVAELTGFEVTTLRNWRYLGKGPAYRKVGRRIRYDADAVTDWQAQSEVA